MFTRVCRVYVQVENDVSRTDVDGKTGRRGTSLFLSTPGPRDAVNIDPPSLNTPRYSPPRAAAAESTGEP